MRTNLEAINSEARKRAAGRKPVEEKKPKSLAELNTEARRRTTIARAKKNPMAVINEIAKKVSETASKSVAIAAPKPSTPKPTPAKKAQTSRQVVVEGRTVTLGPGEEIHSLVKPRPKNS